MENLFQTDSTPVKAGNRLPSDVAEKLHQALSQFESPWSRESSSQPEQKLFTPANRTALPDLCIAGDKGLTDRSVRSISAEVICLLGLDYDYGVPALAGRGQINMSNGLIDSIEFPNNHRMLNISYDNLGTGRIGNMQMDDCSVTFNYDGPNLAQISFSGSETHEPIQFFPHDYPSVGFVGDKQIPADPIHLGREIYDYLKRWRPAD